MKVTIKRSIISTNYRCEPKPLNCQKMMSELQTKLRIRHNGKRPKSTTKLSCLPIRLENKKRGHIRAETVLNGSSLTVFKNQSDVLKIAPRKLNTSAIRLPKLKHRSRVSSILTNTSSERNIVLQKVNLGNLSEFGKNYSDYSCDSVSKDSTIITLRSDRSRKDVAIQTLGETLYYKSTKTKFNIFDGISDLSDVSDYN